MKVRVFYHDSCFDGVASAAVFTRFFKERIGPKAEFGYTGLAHKAGGQNFNDLKFDGDENVIVDFRYYSSDRLTWWFDHHQSAFPTPADEAHFRRDRSGKKFYDPQFKSCTKLIATVTAERFGFNASPLKELIHWADMIDGAQYPNPQTAVEVRGPAMELLTVIEASKDSNVLNQLIHDLQEHSLSQVAAHSYISERFAGLYDQHLKSIDIIRNNSRFDGKVVFFDVTEHNVEGYNKFIPYYLYPTSVYSVGLSQSPTRTKVSVGFNPWSPQPRRHNLATICERYGGGGHPVVAAISLGPNERELARKIAMEIIGELHK